MPSITGAPHIVELNGQKYNMSPLSDADFEELNNWIRSGVIQMVRKSLTKDMTEEERDEILGVAIRQARKISYLSPEGREAMASMDGTAQLLWLGIRHNHKGVTSEQIRKDLVESDDLLAVLKVWEEINMGESATGFLARARSRVQAKPTRKKKSTRS